ncbi:MAG: hypothetical protein SFY95_04775 [Planctomycetota bacterium]|nr:hypothetical protein [Planctomycetota bacterium]
MAHTFMRSAGRAGLWAMLALAGAAAPVSAQTQAQPPAQAEQTEKGTRDYLRVRDERDGKVVMLEIASRELRPTTSGKPTVHLVGVAHIGDGSYYRTLQTYLDAHDVVLYEAVKPAGTGRHSPAELTDAMRTQRTNARLRFLAILAQRAEDRGAKASSLAELGQGLEGQERAMADLFRRSSVDGWDRPIRLVREGAKWDLVSDGPDGVAGNADDVKFRDQAPLNRAERGGGGAEGGLQVRLARAMGLEFQLSAIDYNRPHWRNSDMSIDEVQRRLGMEPDRAEMVPADKQQTEKQHSGAAANQPSGKDAGPAPASRARPAREAPATEGARAAEAVFGLLDGSSPMAGVMNFLLRFVGASPTSRALTKLMMVETLASADKMLEATMGQMQGGMGDFLRVILRDRNQVVLEDLTRLIREEPGVGSVAIFYGAGHLPEMEEKILAMGYEEGDTTWFRAITVDLPAAGVDPAQGKAMREMIKNMIQAQTQAAERMKAGTTTKP